MTEEDTFMALRKPGYKQMLQIWCDSDLRKNSDSLPRQEYLRQLDIFFHNHGWTVSEYSSYWLNNV